MIPVYKPYLPTGSLSYAHEALNSTWLSSQGKYLKMVEEKLQELLKVKYVLPLNNGTSACHLVAKSLRRLNKSPDKKKLIVPNNVYVAAWNAFLFDNDYQLITVDADLATWNVDLDKLDLAIQQHPDAGVLIVHNIGNVINVPILQEKYPGVNFVEDNCEGFLGTYNNRWTGTASYASAISFFGNKNITSGEGGAFITADEEAYLFAKCVQGQGQSEKRFIHKELGYNYRMTNIQAAILHGQLEILPEILERKEQVFYTYRKALKDRQDIVMQAVAPGTQHSNWMFGIRIPGNDNYEEVELFFKSRGIEVRPMFYSIGQHTHLQNNSNICFGECNNADTLQKECLILPSFPELTQPEQAHILQTLEEYVIW